jgi:hypothetical protein
MSISEDLFLAILAMDAYNRGYASGVGNNTDGLGGLGSQIGTATVTRQDKSAEAVAASFFAQSYTWNGQTVISYRGTDVLPGLSAASWRDITQVKRCSRQLPPRRLG